MTAKEQQELTNMAINYDSLSPTLKQIFVSQIGYMPSVKMECEITKEDYLRVPETIKNTSNASSHVDLLKQEYREIIYDSSLTNMITTINS